MEITDVRLRKIETEGKLRAYVSITFDDSFVVHDLRVIDGNKGMFVAMPSKRLPNGDHKDIAHPINTEIREKIQNAVLDVYHRELEETPQVKAEPKVEEEVEESKEEEKEKVVEETATEEEVEKKEEGLF
ncbi:MAG TPA: septation protein SpoVG [Candidatus Atribacteria bacterium]|nr:septation protein SpoVG [Candidatus Atribacteria bacterium]